MSVIYTSLSNKLPFFKNTNDDINKKSDNINFLNNESKPLTNIVQKFDNKTSKVFGDYKLYAEITSFKNNPNNDTVYYNLKLKSALTNEEWEINRRYSDFYEYYTVLTKNFYDLPTLPRKTLTKVVSLSEIEERKERLNSFIRIITKRSDIMSNMATYFFLDLNKHFVDFKVFQPLVMYEINDLVFEAVGLDYVKEGSLIFVGLAKKGKNVDKLINKFSSYINTSLKNSNTTLGKLQIYNMISSVKGQVHLELLFENNYKSQISYIKFNKTYSILVLGYESGEIRLLRIYITEKSYITNNLVDEIACIRACKKSIVDVEIDFTTGYVFSVSSDNFLVLSEYNYQTVIKTLNISSEKLTTLLYNQENQLLILADSLGSLYFYNVSNPINPIRLQSIHKQFSGINYINLLYKEKNLLIGCKTGELYIFKVRLSRDGMHMEQENIITIENGINIVKATKTKNYYILGLDNGSIAIYNLENRYPEYIVPFHQERLGSYVYIENKHLIISCSYDKSLKVYQLPMYFPAEMMCGIHLESSKTISSNNNILQTNNNSKSIDVMGIESIENSNKEDIINNNNNYNNYNSRINQNEFDKRLELLGDVIETKNSVLKNKEIRGLTEKEIKCVDLNGWDHFDY